MPFHFDRPIGAGADVSELEFVSALMQTDVTTMRTDCSIDARDVSLYLASRYGVKMTPEEVSSDVLKDFTVSARSEDKDDASAPTTNRLDLMEFVSLLLIPHLCKDRKGGETSSLLKTILRDALGHDGYSKATSPDGEGIVLTVPLLRQVFASLGETALAQQEDVLQDMVEAVARNGGQQGEQIILNDETFTAAMLHDLKTFDPAFPQIYRALPPTGSTDKLEADEESDAKDSKERQIPVKPMASCIDLEADLFRSRLLVIFMWAFFGMSFLTYYSGVGTFLKLPQCQEFHFRATWAQNFGAFLCTVAFGIVHWLYILFVMGVYGVVYFGATALGNGVDFRHPILSLIGAGAAAAFTVVPLYIPAFTRGDPILDLVLKIITTVFGGIVVILNVRAAASEVYQRCARTRDATAAYPKDPMVKEACLAKTDTLVSNALKMHEKKDASDSFVQTRVGRALLNYANYGNSEYERVGGFYWTWKKIYNRELFKNEGVWMSGRLLGINFTQFGLAFLVLGAGIYITILATNSYVPPLSPIQELFNELFNLVPGLKNINNVISMVATSASKFIVQSMPYEKFGCDTQTNMDSCTLDDIQACQQNGQSWLCALVDYTLQMGDKAAWEVQNELLKNAGFATGDVQNNTYESLLQQSLETVNTLYPTNKYMIFWPLLVGTIAAFITAMIIALSVIPSIATTVLKLRTGLLIDLMHDRQHSYFRRAPDQVAYLRGSMFWGSLASSIIMGLIFAVIIFLFVWQNTASVAQMVVATIVGMLIVLGIQLLYVSCTRVFTTQAFYRKRPRQANINLLFRECAYFALTIGYTFLRVAKIIFTTIVFVGRVDVPFLSPGIGEIEPLNYKIDGMPYVFILDVMIHEAHRHPFIEIFGSVCLLKIRHGDAFVSKAGSAWRLLLVSMLMPWLGKYRRLARPNSGDDVSTFGLAIEPERERQGEDGSPQSTSAGGGVGLRTPETALQELQRENRRLKEQLYLLQRMQTERRRRSSVKSADHL
jgi:hypothetical protein